MEVGYGTWRKQKWDHRCNGYHAAAVFVRNTWNVQLQERTVQNMSDEDAKQKSDKEKILAQFNNFDEIDVQAAQKLFVYRPAFLNCFMDTFRISEINSRFKNCMHSAINCRNGISHRQEGNSKFTDEYMDYNLRNLKEIARYLSSVCPAAEEYYKKFCDRFKDALPGIQVRTLLAYPASGKICFPSSLKRT